MQSATPRIEDIGVAINICDLNLPLEQYMFSTFSKNADRKPWEFNKTTRDK